MRRHYVLHVERANQRIWITRAMEEIMYDCYTYKYKPYKKRGKNHALLSSCSRDVREHIIRSLSSHSPSWSNQHPPPSLYTLSSSFICFVSRVRNIYLFGIQSHHSAISSVECCTRRILFSQTTNRFPTVFVHQIYTIVLLICSSHGIMCNIFKCIFGASPALAYSRGVCVCVCFCCCCVRV